MKKKITLITISVFALLIFFTACTNMDPLGIAKGIPEGYNPDVVFDNDWIYYAEGNAIKKMRLDGTGIEAVFTPVYSQGDVWKILLDPVRQKLYIFEHMAAIANNIYQYNLDGTGETLIASEGPVDIMDMSIDHINGYLYYVWYDGIDGGVKSINLEDINIKTEVYSGIIGANSYVGTDYNGRVYYIDGNTFYEVDTHTTSHTLGGVAAITPVSISSSLDGSILYYYDTSVIYKIDTPTEVGIGNIDPLATMYGNMVLYEKGGVIYFLSDGVVFYNIYSINMDGTGTKNLILDNGSTNITTFDILAK